MKDAGGARRPAPLPRTPTLLPSRALVLRIKPADQLLDLLPRAHAREIRLRRGHHLLMLRHRAFERDLARRDLLVQSDGPLDVRLEDRLRLRARLRVEAERVEGRVDSGPDLVGRGHAFAVR